MQKQIPILLAFFISCLFNMQSQNLNEDLSKAMVLQSQNQFKEGTAKFKHYYNENPQAFLEAIKPYCSDTSEKVRALACNLASIAANKSANVIRSGYEIDILIGFISDNSSSIRNSAIHTLQNFKSSEFSKNQKKQIAEVIIDKPFNDIKPTIRLIGFLNLLELNNKLKEFTTNESLKTRQKWEAYLALARMGDTAALNFVISKIKTVPICDDLMYEFIPDLIYTRQKDAFNYIIEILNNDKESCTSPNPDNAGKIICGYRAMEYLAPVIENFPFKTRTSGDIDAKDYKLALKIVRKWFKKQKGDYVIIKDTF